MKTKLLKKLRKQFKKMVYIKLCREENKSKFYLEVYCKNKFGCWVKSSCCEEFIKRTDERKTKFCKYCYDGPPIVIWHSSEWEKHSCVEGALCHARCIVEKMVLEQAMKKRTRKLQNFVDKCWKKI
jgi:hypothetical protein